MYDSGNLIMDSCKGTCVGMTERGNSQYQHIIWYLSVVIWVRDHSQKGLHTRARRLRLGLRFSEPSQDSNQRFTVAVCVLHTGTLSKRVHSKCSCGSACVHAHPCVSMCGHCSFICFCAANLDCHPHSWCSPANITWF